MNFPPHIIIIDGEQLSAMALAEFVSLVECGHINLATVGLVAEEIALASVLLPSIWASAGHST